MRTFVVRLHPGQDLKNELIDFTRRNQIKAGIILTCVGSLQRAALRLAGQSGSVARVYEQKFEILSLVGTLCPDKPHLHIALADEQANTIGGHLQEGSLIETTAEIAIADLEAFNFRREFDQETNAGELVISSQS